jgi:hypothetical protein
MTPPKKDRSGEEREEEVEPAGELKRVCGECPFCNAEGEDVFERRYYKCGSYADRETGEHIQQCYTPIITTQWGPLR